MKPSRLFKVASLEDVFSSSFSGEDKRVKLEVQIPRNII